MRYESYEFLGLSITQAKVKFKIQNKKYFLTIF